ncbi:hypothetical protein HNP99_002657 [Flavobacterium sp. 28A]|uniref:hypothetical protein n=1 Tax=Flavobacterium sp. 28A TaxID=2735895 RepID=UPI00156F63DC|nr:hypothetical protein [Flavobacterium sp. 28A]NRT16293.1 hypothetical protein [Flavobacterium sp. 28A]
MKKQTGIWIDSRKAIIVTLNNGKETVTEIESDLENRIYHDKEGDKGSFIGHQHIDSQNTFDERRKHEINNYFKGIIAKINDTDELYIFGPAETKTKLEHKINIEKSTLPSKLKLVETSDSMTSNQIVAKVKKFFAQ